MKPAADIAIGPFRPEDQAAVKDLILAGMLEHWGVLDPHKNPDLDDIAASYTGAVFLVARQGSRVVGSGALLPRPEASGEIVRMSVAAHLRRQGLGRRILERLREQATALGYRRLVLETTSTWQDAIDFYLGFGFRITHEQDGETHFAMDLIESRDT